MDPRSPARLDPGDSDLIDDEARRFRSTPPRRDPQLSGCLLAFIGMAVLTLTPALGTWVPVSRGLGTALFGGAVAALFGGAVVALAGSAVEGRRVRRELGSALDAVAAWEAGTGDRPSAVRGAARFVLATRAAAEPRKVREVGPGTVSGLGERGVALVAAVDRHLLSH